MPFKIIRKFIFYKKSKFSIPIRTLCGLCVLQSLWAFYLGILAAPFLLWKAVWWATAKARML